MESPIFVNLLRFEKTKDKEKRVVSQNHRDNYTENNKSRIFTPLITVFYNFILE